MLSPINWQDHVKGGRDTERAKETVKPINAAKNNTTQDV